MSDYKPVEGDRVRVVLEGKVENASRHGDDFYIGQWIYPYKETVVSVEKIEPPVVTFKPGDVVRRKDNADCVYALGHRQFLAIGAANTAARAFSYDAHGGTTFTSESYELVISS